MALEKDKKNKQTNKTVLSVLLYVSCITIVYLHEDLRLCQCCAGRVMQQKEICKIKHLCCGQDVHVVCKTSSALPVGGMEHFA